MMKQLNKHIFFLAFLTLFLNCFAYSQSKINKQAIEKEFPNEPIVYNKFEVTMEFLLEENKPIIDFKEYKEYYYITDKKLTDNQLSVRFSSSFEKDIKTEAYTYSPNSNGQLKKIKIDKFHQAKSVSNGVFYDDNEEITYTYPGIKKGALATLAYQCKIKEPVFIPSVYFKIEKPIIDNKITIVVPDNFKVRFLIYGDSSGINRSIEKKKNKTIYTFEAFNSKKIEYEDEAPSIRYYVPHLIIIPQSYEVNKKTIPLLNSVEDLFRWYDENISGVNLKAGDELKRLTDSLTKNYSDSLDKVKSIYYWVQKNIEYVAFEEGMEGFIPREADQVLKKRYGDCKDKSSLLVQMLKLAGIPAYYTWIGTRDIPYSYYEIPTPICDNHMIASTKIKGEWIFLDGTSTYLKFRLPTSMIQGKEALIRIDKDKFVIQKVPVVNKMNNCRFDSIQFIIKEGNIFAKGNSSYSGFLKETFTREYKDARKNSKEEVVSSWLETGNNKFKLNASKINGLASNDSELQIKYEFELPNYVTSVEDELFINFNFDQFLKNDYLELGKRKNPKQNQYLYNINQTISYSISDNYELLKVPDNESYHTDHFGFEIKYEKNDKMITLLKNIYLNDLLITKETFPEYNSMIDKISKAYKAVVVLKKKK